MVRWVGEGKQDKRYQSHTSNAVSFKTVGSRANRVTSVVTSTVGNNTRVAWVVLANLEYHLHQVATNVGNLGEDTTGDTQSTCSKRFANGEANEAATSQVGRHKHQDDKHQEQLNANQHDANAHTSRQWDVQQVERATAKRCKRHASVGEGVHSHAKPSHSIGAQNTNNGPSKDKEYRTYTHSRQQAKVQCNGCTNKEEQDSQELTLLLEVGRACLENYVANLKH